MKIELTFKILTEKIIFTIFGSQSQSDIQSIQINDKIIRTKQREKKKIVWILLYFEPFPISVSSSDQWISNKYSTLQNICEYVELNGILK